MTEILKKIREILEEISESHDSPHNDELAYEALALFPALEQPETDHKGRKMTYWGGKAEQPAPTDEVPDCDTCEGHGVVATTRNDMDGWPVEAACPACNAPIPEKPDRSLSAVISMLEKSAEDLNGCTGAEFAGRGMTGIWSSIEVLKHLSLKTPTPPAEARDEAREEGLLPCPWCDGRAFDLINNGYIPAEVPDYFILKCIACNAIRGGATYEEAVKEWNTRPIIQHQPEAVEWSMAHEEIAEKLQRDYPKHRSSTYKDTAAAIYNIVLRHALAAKGEKTGER